MAAIICCEYRLAGFGLINLFKGSEKHRDADTFLVAGIDHESNTPCVVQMNKLSGFPRGRIQAPQKKRGVNRHLLRRTLSLFHADRIASAFGLRIDVDPSPSETERELEMLYHRLYRRGDALHKLPVIDVDFPELLFRYREADGEHYIYVEDLKRKRLAGYTVFNRLIELDRRADRYLRATHSKYAAPYQRRGIATAIYTWWLDAGHCLISGARQSTGAHALWQALGRRYDLFYVDLSDKTLGFLGWRVEPPIQEALHTRMILLGKGWNTSGLAEAVGMQLIEKPRKAEHRPLNQALICRNET